MFFRSKLTSTWADPAPVSFQVSEGGSLPGLIDAVTGMKVGGRRRATIPFADAWGKDGQEKLGLPAETDLVVVIDLLAAFRG